MIQLHTEILLKLNNMKKIYLSPPHMSGKELDYIKEVFDQNWIADASFFDTAAAQDECWKIREDVAALEAHAPHNQHFDISIPIDQIGTIINQIIKKYKFSNGDTIFSNKWCFVFFL